MDLPFHLHIISSSDTPAEILLQSLPYGNKTYLIIPTRQLYYIIFSAPLMSNFKPGSIAIKKSDFSETNIGIGNRMSCLMC